MKAIRMHEYGDAGVLRYEDAPMPAPGPGEVLVKVVAAAVNPVDWKIRQGFLQKHIPYPLPLIPGWDVSGKVEAVGPGASRFRAGDAVYSRPDIQRNGAYAEYVVIREEEVAYKPDTISHVEAASLPLAGITAFEALFTEARLGAGQRVLIHAGSGGVGSLAVQMAKAGGAQVIATASGKNRALVESLGADEVIDYQARDFAQEVKDVDVILDTLGGKVQEASWSVLKPGGVLVSLISPPPEDKAKAVGARGAYLFIQPDAAVLNEIAAMVAAGKLRPVIGAEFALEDAAKAQALSQSGRAVGKIVLYVGRP